MPESEVERLKKLREKQLQARDPLQGTRKFQRTMSVKEKRMRKPISLIKDWRLVPYVVKLPLYMTLLGIFGAILLARWWDWEYAFWVGLGATLFLAILAGLWGNALDLREDIKKHLR